MTNKKPALPPDIAQLTRAILQGQQERRRRLRLSRAPEFDLRAQRAIEAAAESIGGDIPDDNERFRLRKKVLESLERHIPYEYMGDCRCGRTKFYRYRNQLCRRVAEELEML